MLDMLAAAGQTIHWYDLGLKEGIDLGFFTLRYYSLAYLGGLLLGYWHLTRMIKAPGAPMAQRHADDLFFYVMIGIIVGGRLGYAAFYTGGDTGIPSLFTNFSPDQTVSWDLLRLWDGGMSFHGGLMGTLVAIAYVCWRGHLSFLRVSDYIAVNVGFGMLFGRLANFINGELWGRPAPIDLPWAMTFCDQPPQAGIACASSMIPRHPSQLYEAALEGLLVIAIMLPLFWLTRARWRPGLLVGVFAMLISGGRFVVEFFREPDSQLSEFAATTGLSMGQWLTVPLILVGLVLAVRALMLPPLGGGKTKDKPKPKPAAAA